MAVEQDWAEDKQRFVDGPHGVAGPGALTEGRNLTESMGPLAAEFLALATALADAPTVHGVLDRVVRAARAVVPGADLVSVTMRAPVGGFHTPVETDGLATRLDEEQYRLDEGPCLEATRTPGPGMTFSPDLGAGREYPRFGPAAAALGAHSVLAVGLFPRSVTEAPVGERLGALNIYSLERGGLDARDRDLALVLGAHVSTALAATVASTAAELEVAQLREALRTRDVIGQAKGILMERRGISADEAFDTLRSASQSLNVKLAQVAETLVTHRAEI